jgi:hypothetical protein
MLMLDEFLMQDEIVDPAPPPTVRHRFYNEVDDVSVVCSELMYVVNVARLLHATIHVPSVLCDMTVRNASSVYNVYLQPLNSFNFGVSQVNCKRL